MAAWEDFRLLQKQVEQLTVTVHQNQAKINLLQSDVQQISLQKINQLEDRIKVLEEQFDALKAIDSVDIKSLEDRMKALEEQFDAIKAIESVDIKLFEDRINVLEERFATDINYATNINFTSRDTKISIAKVMILLLQIPVVQDSIFNAWIRAASCNTSKTGLMAWGSLLNSSKHNYYGGGVDLKVEYPGHLLKHGYDIVIPSDVVDSEFDKSRNDINNNDISDNEL